MYKITLDWAVDYDCVEDLLLDTFRIAQDYNCRVTIMELEGAGSGWPEVRFEGEYNDLKKLSLEHGLEKDDFKDLLKLG